MLQDYGPAGKCFRFNPNGVIQTKAGDYGSIYLRLNLNRREYLVQGMNNLHVVCYFQTHELYCVLSYCCAQDQTFVIS